MSERDKLVLLKQALQTMGISPIATPKGEMYLTPPPPNSPEYNEAQRIITLYSRK